MGAAPPPSARTSLSFETAAESFDALPPEQSAATLGAAGVVALLALTSVVAAKRDADYFEPKVFVFGDSIIADRSAAAARAEEAQAWIDAWYRTDAGAKTFKRVKHRSLAYEDPTMGIDALTITTGTGKKPVPRRPSAFRSDRDALLHDAYHKSIEIVDGVKLDKKILNVVRDFEANLTVIDIRQARRILKLVTDGPVRDHKRAAVRWFSPPSATSSSTPRCTRSIRSSGPRRPRRGSSRSSSSTFKARHAERREGRRGEKKKTGGSTRVSSRHRESPAITII